MKAKNWIKISQFQLQTILIYNIIKINKSTIHSKQLLNKQ